MPARRPISRTNLADTDLSSVREGRPDVDFPTAFHRGGNQTLRFASGSSVRGWASEQPFAMDFACNVILIGCNSRIPMNL